MTGGVVNARRQVLYCRLSCYRLTMKARYVKRIWTIDELDEVTEESTPLPGEYRRGHSIRGEESGRRGLTVSNLNESLTRPAVDE